MFIKNEHIFQKLKFLLNNKFHDSQKNIKIYSKECAVRIYIILWFFCAGKWTCKFDEMQCPSGRCIPLIWKCDGKAHCEDHVDETNCQGAFFFN